MATPPSSSKPAPNNNADPKEGEVRLKEVENSSPTKTTRAASSSTSELCISPAKRRLLQTSSNKSTYEYQSAAWMVFKETVNKLLNQLNQLNIRYIIRELFKDNFIRYHGFVCRRLIEIQIANLCNTDVYAAFVSILNRNFPKIGKLIGKRLILSFHRTYTLNNKHDCMATIKFIAHLTNQHILNKNVVVQILTRLVKKPTDDNIKLGIECLQECGQNLSEAGSQELDLIFSSLKQLLLEPSLDQCTKNMIENIFAEREHRFKSHSAVPDGLKLVEKGDQHTHVLELDDPYEPELILDSFEYDKHYEENEEKYKKTRKIIPEAGDTNNDNEPSCNQLNSNEEKLAVDVEAKEIQRPIIDQTSRDLQILRDQVHLRIQSSIGAIEAAEKLLKIELRPGQMADLCEMVLSESIRKSTYEKFFGLLAAQLCLKKHTEKKNYAKCYEKIFADQYAIVHHLTDAQIENVAQFFAQLLIENAISWRVLRCIRLTEENTTSSSRVYIKKLFLKLAEYLGLTKLNNRLTDPTSMEYFEGLFPRDNPKNARFSINFFTSIELGGLTDELREFLETTSRAISPFQAAIPTKNEEKGDDDSNVTRHL